MDAPPRLKRTSSDHRPFPLQPGTLTHGFCFRELEILAAVQYGPPKHATTSSAAGVIKSNIHIPSNLDFLLSPHRDASFSIQSLAPDNNRSPKNSGRLRLSAFATASLVHGRTPRITNVVCLSPNRYATAVSRSETRRQLRGSSPLSLHIPPD
ncbi:hypothetical protein LY76DRAFT_306274 [Colletotrichum caudatum]|nr:hypothetical protein LY76DRAFT_306274 [Colletotrichum caudatum]